LLLLRRRQRQQLWRRNLLLLRRQRRWQLWRRDLLLLRLRGLLLGRWQREAGGAHSFLTFRRTCSACSTCSSSGVLLL
jgi:hypothetical protein